jgi:hypothetical protein
MKRLFDLPYGRAIYKCLIGFAIGYLIGALIVDVMAVTAYARGASACAGAGGAAACGIQYAVTDGTATQGIGATTSSTYVAVPITPDASFTAYTMKLYLLKVGSPTGTITIEVCTNTADGHPNSCTVSATQAEGDLTTSAAPYELTLSASYSITSGTPYVLKITTNRAVSGTDYSKIQMKATGSTYYMHTSADAATWAAQSYDIANIQMSNCP